MTIKVASAILIVLAALATGCASGPSRRGYGPYEGYERPDPYALEWHQERERARLEAVQRERRERLQREQERERRELKEAGEWDRADRRRQQRDRQRQQGRFEQQDRTLEEHQQREREDYGRE